MTKNGPLRNSRINLIFLWRLPIQNHLMSPITKKRINKAKYLTWNSIWLTFVKKTSTPNSIKSLGYIECYSSSSPRPVKSSSNSIRHKCKMICSWSKRPKIILEIRKEATLLKVINNSIIYKFFKGFTNHRKNINRAVVFSSRFFPNILKYRDHWWDLLTIWKTRLLQTLIKEFS